LKGLLHLFDIFSREPVIDDYSSGVGLKLHGSLTGGSLEMHLQGGQVFCVSIFVGVHSRFNVIDALFLSSRVYSEVELEDQVFPGLGLVVDILSQLFDLNKHGVT
jgi:hypothetical protein